MFAGRFGRDHGFGVVQGDGFFAENVFAGFGGLDDPPGMERVRRAIIAARSASEPVGFPVVPRRLSDFGPEASAEVEFVLEAR